MSQTNPAEAESVAVNFKLRELLFWGATLSFRGCGSAVGSQIWVLSPLWKTCSTFVICLLSGCVPLTKYQQNTHGKGSLDLFHALVCGLGQPSYCSQCEMSSLMKISSTGQSPAAPFVCSCFEIVYDYRDCITSSFCQLAAVSRSINQSLTPCLTSFFPA